MTGGRVIGGVGGSVGAGVSVGSGVRETSGVMLGEMLGDSESDGEDSDGGSGLAVEDVGERQVGHSAFTFLSCLRGRTSKHAMLTKGCRSEQLCCRFPEGRNP